MVQMIYFGVNNCVINNQLKHVKVDEWKHYYALFEKYLHS